MILWWVFNNFCKLNFFYCYYCCQNTIVDLDNFLKLSNLSSDFISDSKTQLKMSLFVSCSSKVVKCNVFVLTFIFCIYSFVTCAPDHPKDESNILDLFVTSNLLFYRLNSFFGFPIRILISVSHFISQVFCLNGSCLWWDIFEILVPITGQISSCISLIPLEWLLL